MLIADRRLFAAAFVVGVVVGGAGVKPAAATKTCGDSGCESPEECNYNLNHFCTLQDDIPKCTIKAC